MFVHVTLSVDLVVDVAHYRVSGRWLDDPTVGSVLLHRGGTARVDPYSGPVEILEVVLREVRDQDLRASARPDNS